MLEISDKQFDDMISKAIDHLPKSHLSALKNVAIVYQDEPTEMQRQELKLLCHETLFGVCAGVPLTRRNGATHNYPPDKITLFKNPMLAYVQSLPQLEEQIRHTLWHEVAHYFGLNHDQIHALE